MTFPSVYEMFDPLTTVRKQRFLDWFSGSVLKEGWTFAYSAGNISHQPSGIADEVDGGWYIQTHNSNATAYIQLDHFNKYQFNAVASAYIAVAKINSTSGISFYVGLHEDSHFYTYIGSQNTYYKFSTRNNLVGSTSTDTSVNMDTAWHVHKADTNGTVANNYIDGVLQITTSSTLPTTAAGALEPFIQIVNVSGGLSHRGSIRYMECWNT